MSAPVVASRKLLVGWTILAIVVLAYFHLMAVPFSSPSSSSTLNSVETVSIRVPGCNCAKRVPIAEQNTGGSKNDTCSGEQSKLGPGQRIVGYSFYEGNTYDTYNRDYFAGISDNLALMRDIYPGFRMRLYYRVTPDSQTMRSLCALACTEELLDVCDIERNPLYGNAR